MPNTKIPKILVDEHFLLPAPTFWHRYIRSIVATCASISIFLTVVMFFSIPPSDFPIGGVVSIPVSSTLSDVANILKRTRTIRSENIFKITALVTAIMSGKENPGQSMIAGDYLFSIPTNTWVIAYRIIQGKQGLTRFRVTFPEGSTVSDMADIIVKQEPSFDKVGFLKLATPLEGYIFPDTYFFFSNASPEDVIMTTKAEFDQKIKTIAKQIAGSKRSIADIITMAAIVEKEALTETDRKVVAGILWKRIDVGMPLQVDAPFAYAIGKSTSELTLDDLAIDSPYNTYKYKGLPKGPIGNPGLSAITATVTGTTTPYWFYLSDSKGVIHYAKNHDQHVANKDKYLR